MNKTYRQLTEKELKWLQKLERLCKTAPDTLFLFCGGGTLEFYAKDENNKRYMTDGSEGFVDQWASNFSIPVPFESDGGDY